MTHRYQEAWTPDGRPINWCAVCRQPLQHRYHVLHHWQLRFGRDAQRWYARHAGGITLYADSWQRAFERGWEYICERSRIETFEREISGEHPTEAIH